MVNFITSKPVSNLNTISSEFGERISPTKGATTTHKGIDFAVPVNTPVYAAHKGSVTKQFTPSGGYTITIETNGDDGNKYSTSYLHLNSYAQITDPVTGELREIREGDEISSGTQIALSGNTGSASSGAHLHFAVKKNGTPQNPRTYLAQAFPSEFPTTVKSGTYGKSLEGDYRANTLIGNSQNNEMSGLEGIDTYVFPSISGTDEIIDSDNDGRIVIGNGSQSVVLQGTMLPKTDLAGNIIPDHWINDSGFELAKSGNDLTITKPGITGSITIKNYPFTATKAFGFSLGKTKDASLGYDSSFQGIDLIFSNAIFPINTPDGGFFGVSKQLIDRPADAYTSYSLVKYDNCGNKISQTSFDANLPTKQVLRPRSFLGTDNRQWTVIPFYCEPDTIQTGADLAKRSVGLCLVDDLGNVVNSRMLATNVQLNGGFALTTTVNSVVSNSIFYFRIDGYNIYQIDIRTLADQNIQGASYDFITTDQAVDRSYAANSIQLRNGNKLSLIYNNQLTTLTPRLRDLTADEIIPNYYVSSGESITPSDTNFIAIIAENTASNLQISLNPNSVGVLMGLDSNPNAKISLPYDLSDAQIYSATDGQYSLDDLLAGKFVADSSALQSRRRRLDGTNGNATLSDDYQYYGGDYDDVTTDDVAVSSDSATSHQQYSVIVLPNNQIVVLVGVNATELVKAPENYFYQATQLTNDPTSQPTILRDPSSSPSLQPVVQTIVTNDPSSRPSQSSDELPTSTPSQQPISIPSAAPSKKTGQPSNGINLEEPTSTPSQQPISIPSAAPSKKTAQPSNGINLEEPTSTPSAETQNPTNSESAKPSNDRSPSSRPSAKISSDVPTSQPSKKSKQPSSRPSNSQISMPTGRPSKQSLMPSVEVGESESPSSEPSNKSEEQNLNPTSRPSKKTNSPSFRSEAPMMFFTNNPMLESGSPTSSPSFQKINSRAEFPSTIVAPIAAALLLAGVGLAYFFRNRIWGNSNVEVAPANPVRNTRATRLVEVSPQQYLDVTQQNHSR